MGLMSLENVVSFTLVVCHAHNKASHFEELRFHLSTMLELDLDPSIPFNLEHAASREIMKDTGLLSYRNLFSL